MYFVLEYGAVRILPLAFAFRPRPLSPRPLRPSIPIHLSLSHCYYIFRYYYFKFKNFQTKMGQTSQLRPLQDSLPEKHVLIDLLKGQYTVYNGL